MTQQHASVDNGEALPAPLPEISVASTRTEKAKSARYRLEHYPVISALLAEAAPTELDGESCLEIYQRALGGIEPTAVPSQELALIRSLGMELPGALSIVVVTIEDNYFVAWLGGGKILQHSDAVALADLLIAEGVNADDVRMPSWRVGDVGPLTGDRIAIFGHMRKHQVLAERNNHETG